MLTKFSTSRKKGCPTCNGNDPKSCMRCRGKTRMCDWVLTEWGWTTNMEKKYEQSNTSSQNQT
jgi:hypothetical protein